MRFSREEKKKGVRRLVAPVLNWPTYRSRDTCTALEAKGEAEAEAG